MFCCNFFLDFQGFQKIKPKKKKKRRVKKKERKRVKMRKGRKKRRRERKRRKYISNLENILTLSLGINNKIQEISSKKKKRIGDFVCLLFFFLKVNSLLSITH
jgi:hypothetical protein